MGVIGGGVWLRKHLLGVCETNTYIVIASLPLHGHGSHQRDPLFLEAESFLVPTQSIGLIMEGVYNNILIDTPTSL